MTALSGPCHRAGAACVAVLATVLLPLLGAPAPAGAADLTWQPLGTTRWAHLIPRDGPGRERLLAVADDGATRELHGLWTRMAPGDTLTLAVRGEGTLRVETRPVFATDARVRRYRLGVRTAPDVWRRLVRREEFATVAITEDGAAAFRLGDVDRWETALLPGSERVLVTLREERSAPVWVRALVRGQAERLRLAESPATTARHPGRGAAPGEPALAWELGATAAAGYDGNAYLTPEDVADTTAVRDAWYLPVELDGEVVLERGLPFTVELDYAFDGAFYEDDILGETRHRLLLRQEWDDRDLGPLGEGRLRLDQRFRSRDRTFFGRGDLEEFITGSDVVPGADVPLGDRFDWREWLLGAELEFAPHRAWEVEVAGFWMHRDYTEDYDQEPDIYALDQDRTGVEVAVRREIGGDWDLGVAGEIQWWDYAEKFARDAAGVEQPDVTTRLRRTPLELELRRWTLHGLRATLAAGTLITRDLRAGYWDRQTMISLAELGWHSEDDWEVELRVRRSVTDYDVSTVGNDPGAPLREKDSWRVRLAGEVQVRESVEVFAAWNWEDLENNSRTFAYSRATLETGVRATF
jgi:hypothetical protein